MEATCYPEGAGNHPWDNMVSPRSAWVILGYVGGNRGSYWPDIWCAEILWKYTNILEELLLVCSEYMLNFYEIVHLFIPEASMFYNLNAIQDFLLNLLAPELFFFNFGTPCI